MDVLPGAHPWNSEQAEGVFVDWSRPPVAIPATFTQIGYADPLKVLLVNEKTFWDQSPAIISCLALVVSLGGVMYNALAARSKDALARRQSINDEFWMRKVLFPLSIEPALTYYSSVETTLPKDRFQADATMEAIEKFLGEFTATQAGFRGSALAFGLMNKQLLDAVTSELENIEDVISEYCYMNRLGHDPEAGPTGPATRDETLTSLRDSVLNILKHIKSFQEGMK